MKKILLIITGLFFSATVSGQISNVEEKFALPPTVNESSGAIFYNGKLILHNDSGNENKLHELDTISGMVTRTVTINNATNIDWEDITQDESFIFVGDFGNNSGDRTDLKIYKVSKTDYNISTSVEAEIINFSYADQIDFTSQPNNTEWDAEALISLHNNLILFTKNWVNGITKTYAIPKQIGTYEIDPMVTTLSTGGLISGATLNRVSGIIYLVGYTSILQPFIWRVDNFTNTDIFNGNNTQTFLSELAFEQVEGISPVGENRFIITSESFNVPPISDYAKLVTFDTNDILLNVDEHVPDNFKIFPVPVKDTLIIEIQDFVRVEIFDSKSSLVKQGNDPKIKVSDLQKGGYIVKIFLTDGSFRIKKIIKE